MSEATYEKWFTETTWNVNYTLPKNDAKGRTWVRNDSAVVICKTAERACAIVLECEPDATIHGVNRGGRGTVLVDRAAAIAR